MTMNILYAGAGALATGCAHLMAPQATYQWALRRSAGPRSPFDLCLAADLTQMRALPLPEPATHVLYTATPDARTPDAYRQVYDEGLARLVAALDTTVLQRFVFVSSTAVYGPARDWVDEDTPADPPGFNGRALLEAETRLRDALGDRLVVLRLAGLYGPARTRLLARLRAGQVTVPDGTGHWANRLHEDDAVRLCAWAMGGQVPCGTYIGVDNTPLEIAYLYDTLAAWLGAPPVRRGPYQPPSGKRLSNQRVTRLGFCLRWPATLEGYRCVLREPDASH